MIWECREKRKAENPNFESMDQDSKKEDMVAGVRGLEGRVSSQESLLVPLRKYLQDHII